ncbi:MAG: hypothetical protein QOD75_2755 [Blastocatellia bacterium]|jgi:uncharacterized membrane protein YkoI|nr:hypothetical protein [Blastocatellia bacterium]
MKHVSGLLRIGLTIIAIALAGSFASAQERQVKAKDVPVAVRTAFKAAYPNATIKGYAREKENGKTFYEIESTEGATGRDVLYNPDGSVAEVEETIALSDLPTAVQEAIRTKYPNAAVRSAEKTVTGDKVSYDVIVKNGRRRLELEFDADGNLKQK